MSAVSLKDVSFQYPGHAQWILKDLSFELEQHKVLAIIGKSGCGKSTILSCLTELLDKSSGKISYKYLK